MNKTTSRPWRIFVDHGEAYGNLGDEAMLLNALERLTRFLGPCDFFLTSEPGKPLPQQLPKVEPVRPANLELERGARQFAKFLGLCQRLPLIRRLVREPLVPTAWKMAKFWINVKVTLWQWGILRSPGKFLLPFLEALKSCDAFYGVGAADFNDLWHQGVIYKSWLYTVASRYVKVCVVSSQGIGPLATKWARRRMARALSRLDLLSFRDHFLSQQIVEEEKISRVRYKIVGDEAFSLATGKEETVKELLRRSGLPEGASFIAVHFRTTDYTQDTSHWDARIAAVLDQVAEIIPHFFVFFPMSYHLHSGNDEEYGRTIRSKMRHRERLCVAPTHEDVRVIKGAVGQARYSLGLSYHIHVFSLSQGHPAAILFTGDYYRCKSEGLVSFYGKPNAALNLAATPDDHILEAIRELETNYHAACEAITRVNQELLQVNDWTLRELAVLLERGGGQ